MAPIVTSTPSTTTEAPATSTTDTTTSTPATTDTTTTESTTTESTDDHRDRPTDDGSSDRSDSGTSPNDSEDPGVSPDDGPDPTVDGTTTAAGKLGWGTATGIEDFDGDLETNWSLYDGPGHAGNGRRSPSAMSVSNGVFTITGDANGTTGGMAWKQGRSQYGRWEARVKSPVADPSYNAVMLLWPDAENWPVGGEVDFMEIGDETRQEVDFFLHYGEENHQLHDQVAIDATQWHNWAVEWAPGKITGYVDGEPWFSTTQASALPPGPMHLTLQLDWFPKGGSVQQSTMDVDWVRYYPIDGSGVLRPDPEQPGRQHGQQRHARAEHGHGHDGGTGTGSGTDAAARARARARARTAAPAPTRHGHRRGLDGTDATSTSVAGTTTSATTTITEPDPPSDDTAADDAAPVVTENDGESTATDGGAPNGTGTDNSGTDGTASTGSDGSGSTTAAG